MLQLETANRLWDNLKQSFDNIVNFESPNTVRLILLVVFIAAVSFNYFSDPYQLTYDTARNMKIISEFSEYGTLSYYDNAYVMNPPLYFMIYGTLSKIFGISLLNNEIFDTFSYFLGAVAVYLISKEIGFSNRTGLFAFLIIITDGYFLGTSRVDFMGITVLFSALLILFYIKLLNNLNYRYAIALGVVFGLSMLVKSVFLFLIIVFCLHYFIYSFYLDKKEDLSYMVVSGISGLIIYSPWMYYLKLNNLPTSFDRPELTGNIPWMPDWVPDPFYMVYVDSIKVWPIIILFSLGIVAYYFYTTRFQKTNSFVDRFYDKTDDFMKFNLLLIFIIVITPFFVRLILKLYITECFVGMMVAATLLCLIYLKKINNKMLFLLFIILLLGVRAYDYDALSGYSYYQSTYEASSPYHTEFLSTLGNNISILDGTSMLGDDYLNNVNYGIYSDHLWYNDYDIIGILSNNIDYVTTKNQELPYFNKSYFILEHVYDYELRDGNVENIKVYKVDLSAFASSFGLGNNFKFSIKSNDQPIQAKISVAGNGFSFRYKSKRNGDMIIFVPVDGVYQINIFRMGYEPHNMLIKLENNDVTYQNLQNQEVFIVQKEQPININLDRGSSFIHGETETRF